MNRRNMWTYAWVVGFAACGGGLGGLLISNDKEVEMGLGVAEQIAYDSRLAALGEPVSKWANELLAPLVTASVEFRDPNEFGGYKVRVIVDDELVNAFAAPGGFTYLSTGLILRAQSCAEIAGVMGHELGHVTERHGVKRIEEAMAVGLLSDVLLGESLVGSAAEAIYGVLLNTQFSQDAEEESDTVGLQVAFGAGYNPYGLVDFFEKLLALSGGEADPVSQFLSSHPANTDRIADVSRQIEERYGATVVRDQTQTYDCIGTSLSLAQIQAQVAAGVQVEPGTGEGPPADPAAQAEPAAPAEP